MKITSIIKDSFQEYEDHHSLVLFAHGCNMRCSYCYNLKEIMNPNNIIGNAKEVIEKHITPMHDSVVFLGGEPTIWNTKLIEAATYVKSKGLKVKVYTNGILPEVVKKLNNQKLVNAYSVDLKTVENDVKTVVRTIKDINEYLSLLQKTINNILNYNLDIELRTTKYEGLNLEKLISWKNSNYPDLKHIITEDHRKYKGENN